MRIATFAVLMAVLPAPAVCSHVFSAVFPQNVELVQSYFDGSLKAVIIAADLDRDGKQDLVFVAKSNEAASTSVLFVALGNGDGTFKPVSHRVLQGPAYGLVSGDFNKDGVPDLAMLVGQDATTLTVLLGVGDATFRSPITLPISGFESNGVNQLASKLVVADLNGDGIPDLCAGPFVLIGNGDGTFKPGLVTPLPVLLATDLNGDGAIDLVTGDSFVSAVLLGKGNGTFSEPLPLGSAIDEVVSGDFNNDGLIDLVFRRVDTGNSVGVVSLALGNGAGKFQSVRDITMVSGPLATADFNQDTKLDLVIGDAVILGNGDGTFQIPNVLVTRPEVCQKNCGPIFGSLAIVDWNRDGKPDIALAYSVPANLNLVSVVSAYTNNSSDSGVIVPGVSAASGLGPAVPGSIVSAFGVNMAPFREQASSANPLPTALGGIRVHVGEALAQLYYVSPDQINYIFPGTSGGTVDITIERIGQPFKPSGITVAEGPPKLDFFRFANGSAAASAVRVNSDGTQTVLPTASCSSSGCVPLSIDKNDGPIYLTLYGTGFSDLNSFYSQPAVFCNGVLASYAGPQGLYPGLSQINFLIPPQAASGKYSILCELRDSTGTKSYAQAGDVFIQ